MSKVISAFTNAKNKTEQDGQATDNDKTKEPMEQALEDFKIQPHLDKLFDFIDTWERFSNLLSPTSLFQCSTSRLLLAASLVPPTLATVYLSRDTLARCLQFCIGFVFFGNPLIQRSLAFLDDRYSRWHSYTQLCNTVLKEVPTNAQLTITMLRIGERSKSPLQPVEVLRSAPETAATVTAQSLHHLGKLF